MSPYFIAESTENMMQYVDDGPGNLMKMIQAAV